MYQQLSSSRSFTAVSDQTWPSLSHSEDGSPVIIVLYRRSRFLRRELPDVLALRDEAPKLGIHLKIIDPRRLDITVGDGGCQEIFFEGQRLPMPDAVINRLGSLTDEFTTRVLRQFEQLSVPTLHSSSATAATIDKFRCYRRLAANGLPVPKTIMTHRYGDLQFVREQLGTEKIVVKAPVGVQGEQVFLCRDERELSQLLRVADTAGQTPDRLMLQQFVGTSAGVDQRVLVVGGEVLGGIQRTAASDDEFRANVSQGAVPERLKPVGAEARRLALGAAEALGLGFCCGVDLLVDHNHSPIAICEINVSPGFNSFQSVHPEANVAREILLAALAHICECPPSPIPPLTCLQPGGPSLGLAGT